MSTNTPKDIQTQAGPPKQTYSRLKILTHLAHHGPDYGYATRKALNIGGNIWEPLEGLEKSGLIEVTKREKVRRGGLRIWYGITDAGRMVLRDDVIWFSERWSNKTLSDAVGAVRAIDIPDDKDPSFQFGADWFAARAINILEKAGATE